MTQNCVGCGVTLTKKNWAPYDGVHSDEMCCRCYCLAFRYYPHKGIAKACYEKWMSGGTIREKDKTNEKETE
ncbi:MAG: hypothetical protein M0P69_07330 [Bacteroidales bacterium]|jgi:hypothetical protein|nr:hypothetical protein [Bacteroidales bacterium]